MRSLRIIKNKPAQWLVSDEVLGVLHALGDLRAPEQAPRLNAAVGHRAISRQSWPGSSFGVRCPEAGETPLNFAEVAFGVREGLL